MEPSAAELLFLNGEIMPLREGRVSVEDRGFQFADGVYEVMRVCSGRVFRLKAHLDRLERSASGIHLPLEYDASALERICGELLAQSQLRSGTIYIQVTRGASRRVYLPSSESIRPTTVVYTRALEGLSRQAWEAGLTLISRLDDRWARCDLKTIALLANVLAKIEANRRGADEVVFYGSDGTVYECGSSNVYAVIHGEVFTHPESPKILNGITRMAIREVCRAQRIDFHETPKTLQDFLQAQEVFGSSTTRDSFPIVAIDGQAIGAGRPGPLTRRIWEAYRALLERETSHLP